MSAPVLFIGGMDSSGGAGLLRDAATATQLGASFRVAVSAVTAQSDSRVGAVHHVPPDILTAQIALAAESGLSAIKIGMLGRRKSVEAVVASLPAVPIVLDPVLRSTSGRDLLDRAGLDALLELLLPRTTLITPNLPELSVLAATLGHLRDAPEDEVVASLLSHGCNAVLVKGGHAAPSEVCEDRLYQIGHVVQSFQTPRIFATARGTGCELASAIAVHLSNGQLLGQAVERARTLVHARLAHAAALADKVHAEGIAV